MSRFVMKQKWFSFGNDYAIKDAAGEEVLRVDGKVFSFGDKLTIKTMDGREMALIDQKLLSWGPTYEIWRNNRLAAVLKKSVFTLFRCEFTVDVPGPDDLLAEGDFWDHEYGFTRAGRTVASVSKKYFSWTDTYGIDVNHGEDPILLLASVVVIDLCCHQDRK
jgi:uncharacterized protein YxjI